MICLKRFGSFLLVLLLLPLAFSYSQDASGMTESEIIEELYRNLEEREILLQESESLLNKRSILLTEQEQDLEIRERLLSEREQSLQNLQNSIDETESYWQSYVDATRKKESLLTGGLIAMSLIAIVESLIIVFIK